MTAAAMVYRWSPRVQADARRIVYKALVPLQTLSWLVCIFFASPATSRTIKSLHKETRQKYICTNIIRAARLPALVCFFCYLQYMGVPRRSTQRSRQNASIVIKTFKMTTPNVPIYGMGITIVLKANSLKTNSLYHRFRFCVRRERSGPEVCIETTTVARTISKQFSILYFPNAMRWKPWKPTMGGAWWKNGMVQQRRAPIRL